MLSLGRAVSLKNPGDSTKKVSRPARVIKDSPK